MTPTGSIVSAYSGLVYRDKLYHIIQFYYNNVMKITNRSKGDQEMR